MRSKLRRVTISVVAWIVGTAAIVVWSKYDDGYRFALPPHGAKLGEAEGVAVYAADAYNVRGTYGLEFQCVELVNRAYAEKLGYRNLARTGNADSYFWHAADKGLVAYENGGAEPPKPWDILVFDRGDDDGELGHVAVITSVDATSVTFIQENFRACTLRGLMCKYLWQDTLPLANPGALWNVSQGHYPKPVAGWTRPRGESTE